MKLLPHVVASAAVGGYVAANYGEPLAIPVALAAGVLPDSDHLLDFYWHYVRKSRKRLFVFFHSWELAFVISIYNLIWMQTWWMDALVAGYWTQMLLDQFGNESDFKFYFWFYRARHRFKRQEALGFDRPGFHEALTDSLPYFGPKMRPWFEARDREMYPEIYEGAYGAAMQEHVEDWRP